MNTSTAVQRPPAWPGWLPALAVATLAGFGLGWWGGGTRPTLRPVPFRAQPLAVHAAASALTAAEPLGSFDEETASTRIAFQRRWRLGRAAAALDADALVVALARERQRQIDALREDDLPAEALLARYAEINPAGAADWIADLYVRAPGLHYSWLKVLFDAWTTKNPAAAIAWTQLLREGTLPSDAQQQLILSLVERDPVLAVRQIRSPEASNDYRFTEIFSSLAAKDRRLACAQVTGLPPSAIAPAVQGIVTRWINEGDPKEAYAWAVNLPVSRARQAAVQELYDDWGSQDPGAATAWLLSHRASDLTQDNVTGIAYALAARDAPAALAWCEQLPPAVRESTLGDIIMVWSDQDPRAAVQYMVALPSAQDQSRLERAVMKWADLDQDTARAWAEALPPGGARDAALDGISSSLFSKDPRTGLDYLAGLPDQERYRDHFGMMVNSWAESDPDEAWKYSQSLSDPKQVAATAEAVIKQLVTTDAERAVGLFAQLPPETQAKAVTGIVFEWTESGEPAATAQWAATLPDREVRRAAWEELIGHWENQDAPAAATWLRDQPACEARDRGIASILANKADELDPHDAIRLARLVGVASDRVEALSAVAANWLQHDRAAATAWIKRAKDFTSAKRAELLSAEDNGSGE